MNHQLSFRLVEPRLGMILSIVLYNLRPKSLKFLQSLNSVQIWRAGCNGKVIIIAMSILSMSYLNRN